MRTRKRPLVPVDRVRPATNKDRRRARRGKAELSPNSLYVVKEKEKKEKKKKPNVVNWRGKGKGNNSTNNDNKRRGGGRRLERKVDSSCRNPNSTC